MRNENDTLHPKTVWKFIKDDLELKIINGELRNADKVPSIADLATEYNVSKTTAQKTLEDMYNDGTITKRKGIGYFVIPYTKKKLFVKHKQELITKMNECLKDAGKLGMSSNDLEDFKDVLMSCINAISSR